MPKSIANYNLTRKRDCNGYDLPALLLNCNVVGWLYSVSTICLYHFQSHPKIQEINFPANHFNAAQNCPRSPLSVADGRGKVFMSNC